MANHPTLAIYTQSPGKTRSTTYKIDTDLFSTQIDNSFIELT